MRLNTMERGGAWKGEENRIAHRGKPRAAKLEGLEPWGANRVYPIFILRFTENNGVRRYGSQLPDMASHLANPVKAGDAKSGGYSLCEVRMIGHCGGHARPAAGDGISAFANPWKRGDAKLRGLKRPARCAHLPEDGRETDPRERAPSRARQPSQPGRRRSLPPQMRKGFRN